MFEFYLLERIVYNFRAGFESILMLIGNNFTLAFWISNESSSPAPAGVFMRRN